MEIYRMCKNELPASIQGFQKLSSDRHTYVQTDRQRRLKLLHTLLRGCVIVISTTQANVLHEMLMATQDWMCRWIWLTQQRDDVGLADPLVTAALVTLHLYWLLVDMSVLYEKFQQMTAVVIFCCNLLPFLLCNILAAYSIQGVPKIGPVLEVCNLCIWWHQKTFIKMISSLSGVRLVFWMLPHLNILCTSLYGIAVLKWQFTICLVPIPNIVMKFLQSLLVFM